MNDWTEQEMRSALEQIAKRAASNTEFRMRAIRDAKAVVEEVAGKKLPENIPLQFLELENGELGMRIAADRVELSDEELEAVAGGSFVDTTSRIFQAPLDAFFAFFGTEIGAKPRSS